MSAALHHRTPTLQALDSRGLPTRHIAYHRLVPSDAAQARITKLTHDAAGRVATQYDPRLFARLEAGQQMRANMTTLYSLSGLTVLTQSVDAGDRLCLFTETGLPSSQWDSRQTHWQSEYDELLRPVLVRETAADTPERVAERYEYGAATSDAATRNQCGRLIRHDDSAGSRSIADYSLAGKILNEKRRFLTLLDEPDWPQALTARDALLEAGEGEISQWNYAPLGEVSDQSDARGHQQRFVYSEAGDVTQASLHVAGDAEQIVTQDIRYNAFGAIEQQTAGNGVVSSAEYDPANGQLLRLRTTRPGNAAVQDLLYEYDPVGNIVRTEDQSQKTRHFANQRIDPVNTYRYDTLYQLVEATGREALGAMMQPGLPAVKPTPGDTSELLNYTQHYQYDAGGNLFELRHVGNQSYTRSLAVDNDTNRALPLPDNGAPPDLSGGFDANGNRLLLDAGQSMHWDARNQLRSVDQVTRNENVNDAERYAYGGDGMRVRKVRTTLAGALTHIAETRYLPGLELRTDTARQEQLDVITVKVGLLSVRCLHWVTGQPEGIDDNQLRYSLDDLLGSSTVELDAEANLISHEGYYPYGGTAWWAARSAVEASYKTIRYSGKERDATGLYYYGFRYYMPWLGRWLNPDPAGTVDGLNLYGMVVNNPITFKDDTGLMLRIAARVVVAAGTMGYELDKHRKTGEPDPAATPATPQPDPASATGSYGDRQAGMIQGEIIRQVEKFDPLEKAATSLYGRVTGLYKATQGESESIAAAKKGAEIVGTLGEFALTGQLSDINKTELATAAGTDIVKNAPLTVKAAVKAAQAATAAATVSREEMQHTKDDLDKLKETMIDGVATSTAAGVAAGAALDAVAIAVPILPVKIAAKVGKVGLAAGGFLHNADELAKLAKKFENPASAETGKAFLGQAREANIRNRPI